MYPYNVKGESRLVMRRDFDDRVDVVPVSDPGFVSNAQRYFISEASLDIAARNPELYDLHELHRRAQTALRVDDVDSILPSPEKMIRRMGPVEENAAIFQSLPVKAFMEQDHQSHLQLHMAVLEQLDRKQMEKIGPALESHIQEHYAMAYLVNMMMTTGQNFQYPEVESLKEQWIELPQEIENQIAAMSAVAVSQIPQQPSQQELAEQRNEEAFYNQEQRKDEQTMAEILRKDALVEADINKNATEVMMQEMSRRETVQ